MIKIAILSATLALTLGACSEQKTLEDYLNNGNDFSAERNYASAIVEYKNAVRLAPRDPNVRLSLAKSYLEQGLYLSAEKELLKAIELGGDFEFSAPLLARSQTKLEKDDSVQALVKRSEGLSDSAYAEVLTYAGISALSHNNIPKGQDLLSQAIALIPDTATSNLALAYKQFSELNFKQSLSTAQSITATAPYLADAQLIEAYNHTGLKDYISASDSFAQYLLLQPQDIKAYFLQADSLIKAGKIDEADKLITQLQALDERLTIAKEYKAHIALIRENYAQARDLAVEVLRQFDNRTKSRMIAGVSSYHLGELEQAFAYLKPIEDVIDKTPLRKVLVLTKFKLGYYADMANDTALLEGLNADDIDLLKASTSQLVSEGNYDGALKVIRKAEELSPDDADLLTQKGLVLLATNNLDAMTTLERAIEVDPTLSDAQLTLGMEYIKQNQDKKLTTLLEELRENTDLSYMADLLEGIRYIKEKNNTRAINSFETVLVNQPNNIAALYNLGLLHQALNQNDEALNYAKKVMQFSPTHRGVLKLLTSLVSKPQYAAEVIDVLEKSYDNKNIYSVSALAQSYRINGQIDEALNHLEAIDPSVQLSANFHLLYGDTYMLKGDAISASELYKKGLLIDDKNYLLQLRNVSALEAQGKDGEALEQIRTLESNYPDNVKVQVLLTYLEARNKNDDKAQLLLKKLRQQKINHPLLDRVEGDMAFVKKNYAQAIEHYALAFEVNTSEINLINLARALKFNDESEQAAQLLERAIENQPKNARLRFLLVDLYGSKDRDKKIKHYLVLADMMPNNVLVFNNLAWNQLQVGDIEQALYHIEKAMKLRADDVTVMESYGAILLANKQYSKAVGILEQVLDKESSRASTQKLLREAKSLLTQ